MNRKDYDLLILNYAKMTAMDQKELVRNSPETDQNVCLGGYENPVNQFFSSFLMSAATLSAGRRFHRGAAGTARQGIRRWCTIRGRET